MCQSVEAVITAVFWHLEWKCMSLSIIVFNEADLFSEGVSQFSGFHHVLHTVSAFVF